MFESVNSLAFATGNFRPYLSEFISHVAAAVRLKSLWQKTNTETKGKQIWYMKKREEKTKTKNQQKIARLLEVSSQW